MKPILETFICILFLIHQSQSQSQEFKIELGNPCNLSEECGQNAECVTSFCQCQSGYTTTPALECKVNYNGNCIEDSECNIPMGLGCIKSVCQCSNILEQSYVDEIGGCVNSTMKFMFHEILDMVNQTELELTKFTTLLHLFMVRGSGQQDTSASDIVQISPETYLELQNIEDQFRSEQNTVSVIATPDKISEPEAKAQLESPQTNQPRQISESTPNLPGAQSPSQSPNPVQSTLPNSFGNLILPILPNQQPNLNNLGLPNFNNNNNNNNNPLDALASLSNVLPQLLTMFKQFLPFLQSFNSVLGSSILNQNPQQGQVNPNLLNSILGGGGGGGGGGLLQALGGGQRGPGGAGGLLQIPGRIFNTFFGRNSTISQISRRILPFDVTNKAIPFLPWPLG